jgi:hypothetical protein
MTLDAAQPCLRRSPSPGTGCNADGVGSPASAGTVTVRIALQGGPVKPGGGVALFNSPEAWRERHADGQDGPPVDGHDEHTWRGHLAPGSRASLRILDLLWHWIPTRHRDR